jgi:oxygen-independent coproporphyrinogen-3 oxidase
VGSGQSAAATREFLDEATLRKERIAFGLRRATGLALADLVEWGSEVAHLEHIGLLESAGDRVKLTRRGRLLADSVGESFM